MYKGRITDLIKNGFLSDTWTVIDKIAFRVIIGLFTGLLIEAIYYLR